MHEESSWLSTLYDLEDEPAADMVFDEIDTLLSSREFLKCDKILQVIDVDRLNTSILISFLSATLPAKNILSNRPGLVQRIEKRLSIAEPFRVNNLLKTLR